MENRTLAQLEPIVERVLLTNDDGIDAPGLEILAEVAAGLAREIWIVAPEHDQSGTSHSISLHEPLRYSRQGPRRFGVSGTPADCVVLAVKHLMGDAPPDLVLSGINRGGNLGIETVFSGYRRRRHDRHAVWNSLHRSQPGLHRPQPGQVGNGPGAGSRRDSPIGRNGMEQLTLAST